MTEITEEMAPEGDVVESKKKPASWLTKPVIFSTWCNTARVGWPQLGALLKVITTAAAALWAVLWHLLRGSDGDVPGAGGPLLASPPDHVNTNLVNVPFVTLTYLPSALPPREWYERGSLPSMAGRISFCLQNESDMKKSNTFPNLHFYGCFEMRHNLALTV